MFYHIVMFKFHDKTDAEEAKSKLEAMVAEIPQLISVAVGVDELQLERSWDMVLETQFASLADYQIYAEHPKHNIVLDWLKARIKSAATVDYTVD